MVVELWNLTPVVRPGASCFMARTIRAGWNGEGRMMGSHAGFYRGPEPSLLNAESEHSRSTWLAVWQHVKDELQQAPNRQHRHSRVAEILAASSCKVSLACTKMCQVETNR
jgi:hypothetical protein